MKTTHMQMALTCQISGLCPDQCGVQRVNRQEKHFLKVFRAQSTWMGRLNIIKISNQVIKDKKKNNAAMTTRNVTTYK